MLFEAFFVYRYTVHCTWAYNWGEGLLVKVYGIIIKFYYYCYSWKYLILITVPQWDT